MGLGTTGMGIGNYEDCAEDQHDTSPKKNTKLKIISGGWQTNLGTYVANGSRSCSQVFAGGYAFLQAPLQLQFFK